MTFHQSSYCSSENYSWEKNENSENKSGRKKLDERNRLGLLLARLYWRFRALFDRLDPPPKHLPVNYEKWADIRLTLKTLTSSIMINELFIKISSTIKLYNISHFPTLPTHSPAKSLSLQSIKHFYVWKIWKWMKNSRNFATQFLFYAMLFEWYENIRFRDLQAVSTRMF